MTAMEAYREWQTDSYFDEATKAELRAIEDNREDIHDRFYKRLSFGTGGLRGVIGAGTNRMNLYTVRQATQGLANYIQAMDGAEKGVAIAYDSRLFSPEFAKEAALCLNANGIQTYLFESLRPTPELSFAVRELGCIAGIVITASHNPRQYNGYKVYWEDGAQITPPHDAGIMQEVSKVNDWALVKTMEESDARAAGLFHIIGEDMDQRYLEAVMAQSVHPEIFREQAGEIKIVYTPLHGTGNIPVRRILSKLGCKKVWIEEEQKLPNGHFPTVAYPNPEDPAAWERALALAKKVDADIVLATDPDADRLGAYAKDTRTGEYVSFTGNMSGMLLAEYLLSEKEKLGCLPPRSVLVETIVTTDMAKAVAKAHGAELVEVLTGFKYIGEQIKNFEGEETPKRQFIFGLEESYGCLAGTYARDKDAIVAVMLLCEAACFLRARGKTLWDGMLALYEKYGYYKEGLTSITREGEAGSREIAKIMERLRQHPLENLAGHRILAMRDYLSGERKRYGDSAIEPLTLPKSDVLYYELSEDAWVCVRPSGTEPKIKFYYGVKGGSLEDAERLLAELQQGLLSLAE